MAQNVSIAGADYPAVPYLLIPITDGGGTNAKFVDTSGATASAAGDVVLGKTAYGSAGTLLTGSYAPTITGNYTANTKNLAISTAGITSTWFGALGFEMLYEARCTLDPRNASNWPLTPSATAQTLTWTTSYTTTANANAVFDRYGKNYNGGAALDYGTYGYVWLCDGFAQLVYTVDEATMGTYHVIANAFEAVYHYGSRPRVASGSVVFPSASAYGTYGQTSTATLMTYYRTDAGAIALQNNCSYGVSLASVAPQQQSTTSVKPTYVNFRYPTIGVRTSDSYMTSTAYSYVDWAKTKVQYRVRLYRVPIAYDLYTEQNRRMVNDMILGKTFPAEPL